MLRTHRKVFVIAIVLILLSPFIVEAQESQSVGLKSLISQLEERFNVKFSFVDQDVNEVQIKTPQTTTLQEILKEIAAQTQFEIQQLSNRYYTLRKIKRVSICGRVLDNYAKNKVSGATVQVLGTDQALITELDGSFRLDGVLKSASLQIRYLGYQTKIVSVSELIMENECPNILLAERREELSEVVVYEFLTSGIVKEKDGGITLKTEELGMLPGLIEPDVLFGVQALPGIKSIDETVSDINVRGGTNDQNLILWNGIKMYQSGHFFGLISAFNPYLTDKVSIYKNGTPAQYGDGVSSVISMETRNEISDYFYGGAGINLISGDVFGQIPVNDRVAFQFSARRSTTDFLNTPAYNSFRDRAFQDTEIRNEQNQQVDENIEITESFLFYDFSGKLLYDYNQDHKFRLSFIGIDNDLDYSETDIETNETSRSFLDQTNISVGLQWMGNWSERFSSHVNAYFSQYTLDALSFYSDATQQLEQKNTVEERALKLNTQYEISDSWAWNNGFQYIETGITNLSQVTEPSFSSNIKDVIRIYAPYSEIQHTAFQNRLIASFGLRANYINNLSSFGASFEKLIFEPRLNLNFRVAKNLRAQVLGEFKSQSTNQVIDLEQNFLGIEKRRWTLSNEEDLPLTKSQQGSFGLNYEKNKFYLGIEAFYKQVDGVSTRTQGFQNENQFSGEIGSYEVKGLEFLINKKGKNYSAWLSYTYNKNDYTFDSIVPQTFPNNLDVRHAITLASTYELSNLKLGLGLNYRTGRPYTEPLEDDPIDDTVFPLEINYESPNSSRLPDYFRVDASAIYSFPMGREVKANLGVSLLNITGKKNVLNRYYRISDEGELESVENNSLGITPNVNFRISF